MTDLSSYGWSVHEDVCIIFFASNNVFWHTLPELLRHLCGTHKDTDSIFARASAISRHYELFCVERKEWNRQSVVAWVRSQRWNDFLDRLCFQQSVLDIILKVLCIYSFTSA